MAAVEPPAPAYSPTLPHNLIRDGLLSLAQLEAVVYAGQAHSAHLPNGSRKGFFIGDGTGVGKGREISGIILDNMLQGRRKAVWISFNEGLIEDARRDFSGIGGDPGKIFFQGKTKAGGEITQHEGILFTTYATLRGGEKKLANDHGQKTGKSRTQQIIEWLGEDFDGVIAFDEAHSMANSIAIKGKRGTQKPSQQAVAGINLQHALPHARVVYVSATGATEVSNLRYADRLGLWGEGTAFADANAFVENVSKGGIAAMELISRDMKALGMYLSRSLSYDGVTYERLEHPLSELQEDIYNELAGAWQIVLHNVDQALELTLAGKNPQAKSATLSQFWGAHQRFFNQVITAMQTPTVIDHIRHQLEAGNVAVIQLVNTNEAAQDRIIAEATANHTALEDLDFTPRQSLIDYVKNGFPVAAYEESQDDNGNTIYLPVLDSEGNQVFDREAIALRDSLLDTLQQIRVPENPLDSILNAFGSDKVAEVTGRSRRFIQTRDEDGNFKLVQEKRGRNASAADAEAFQADRKDVLVFSGAGGTGYSFHADNTAPNQRKRIHYILQPGWQADKAVQGFGRTHRTNQAREPHYVLPTTNLKAQKRFVSSIARRLDQLGALTRGQREATSQGIFTAADNLESEHASTALKNFFGDLYRDRTSLNFQELSNQMGLKLTDETGSFNETNIPSIPQFLNRLLSLKTDMQNAVFDEFEKRLIEAVEYSKQQGLYDVGLQTLKALSIKKTNDQLVYEDKNTGAKTRYVELAVTNKVEYEPWENARRRAVNGPNQYGGWFVSEFGNNKGEVFYLRHLGTRLDSDGKQVDRGVIHSIRKNDHRYVDNTHEIIAGEAYRYVDADYRKITLARRIDETTAEKLWNAQIDAAPQTVTKTERMIVGVILPIWDRVAGSETIKRLQTDDGEQLLGRMLTQKAAKQTRKNLGINTGLSAIPTSALFSSIKHGNKAILSNGWEVSTVKVNYEDRIEIKARSPFTDGEKRLLKEQGAFVERINWAERVFLPTRESGEAVFRRITESKPVVDLINRKQPTIDDELQHGLPTEEILAGTRTSSMKNLHDRYASEVLSMGTRTKTFPETVAENLIQQLKEGTAPWQRPWQPAAPASSIPLNPSTGKRYRGINSLHLIAQGRNDPRWMTYIQAQSAGYQVRRGEKGTRIQYWHFSELRDRRDEHGNPVLDAEGNPLKEEVKLERPRSFGATVFNAEQVDGMPPLEQKPVPWNAIDRAEAILAGSGAVINHGVQDRAFYRVSTDSIHLPMRSQFDGAEGYYATALHELGHWSGHVSRLDRDLSHPFGSEGYAREELRAEIASLLLGHELGIGHDPGQHAAYVASWIKVLEDDPLEIFRAAAAAEKIQEFVLSFEQKQELAQEQSTSQGEVEVREEARGMSEDQSTIEVVELSNRFVEIRSTPADWLDYGERATVASEQFNRMLGALQRRLEPYAEYLDPQHAAVEAQGHLMRLWEQDKNGENRLLDLAEDEIPALIEKSFGLKAISRCAAAPVLVHDIAKRHIEITDGAGAKPDIDAKIYLDVPFKEKKEAKALGALWDRSKQSWFVPGGTDLEPFARWSRAGQGSPEPIRESTEKERQYLAVPYGERQAAKALGAKWDKAAKSWYVGPEGDLEKLKRWLPENVPGESQAPAMSPREEFAEALRSAEAIVDGLHPIMDGTRQRIQTVGDKQGEKAGFYVGHLDGHPAGYIKNNRTGVEVRWKSKGYALDPDQKAKLQAEAAEKLQERGEEERLQHERIARRIGQEVGKLLPVTSPTAYLQAKEIAVQAGILTDAEGKTTYIPAHDADGKIWSMQYIREDGTKRFAKGSKKEACFHAVGGMEELSKVPAIVIAEGYSTACSLSEALGYATVAAFDSGNLPPVAQALRTRYPDKPIIIAGDNDIHLESQGVNPGRTKAEEAARAVGGKAMFPIFAPGEQSADSKNIKDWNDLATKSLLGKDGVRRQARAVVSAALEKHQAGLERARREEQEIRQEREPRAVRR